MGSKEWPPCTPSQENKSTQEGQRKVANTTNWTNQNQPNSTRIQQTRLKDSFYRIPQLIDQNPSKQWTNKSPAHQESNPIRAGTRIQQNPQLDPAKPIARSNKTNGRVGQQWQPNSTQETAESSRKSNSQIQQRGMPAKCRLVSSNKGWQPKTTTSPNHRLNRLDEVSVTVNLTTFEPKWCKQQACEAKAQNGWTTVLLELECENKEKMRSKLHQWVSRRELVD